MSLSNVKVDSSFEGNDGGWGEVRPNVSSQGEIMQWCAWMAPCLLTMWNRLIDRVGGVWEGRRETAVARNEERETKFVLATAPLHSLASSLPIFLLSVITVSCWYLCSFGKNSVWIYVLIFPALFVLNVSSVFWMGKINMQNKGAPDDEYGKVHVLSVSSTLLNIIFPLFSLSRACIYMHSIKQYSLSSRVSIITYFIQVHFQIQDKSLSFIQYIRIMTDDLNNNCPTNKFLKFSVNLTFILVLGTSPNSHSFIR